MRIKSIYIDGLHNAVNKTYTFGDIAYIFGNNGIGKSTILQAIQYALLGYIPGTAKNSKEAILRHSPKGSIEVKICLTDTGLDSDIVVTRKVTSTGIQVDTTPGNVWISDIIQDLELPIFNFNEFIGQTANKLKEYFIKNILPTVNSKLDWKKILSDSIIDCNFLDKAEILDYGLSLIPVNEDSDDILEQVVSANAKFKEELSFTKSELQRLQYTIDSLIYYDDYTGPTNVDELNTEILAANSLRDQLLIYESASAATRTSQLEYERLSAEIDKLGGSNAIIELNTKLTQLQKQYQELSETISSRNVTLTEAKSRIASGMSIISGNGVCPYTKTVCSTITDQISAIEKDNANQNVLIDQITEELNLMSGNLNNILTDIHNTQNTVAALNSNMARIENLKITMSNLPEKPDTDKTVFDLNQEIEVLTRSKEKLQANIYYNETIENITKLKYAAELHGTALAKWVKTTDTNGLQTTLMQQPFEELADKMTSYICQMYGRSDIKAHFNISTKANSFSFGLIRDNTYIPYDMLSSGEKCLYNLALMICIVNTGKSPLKLLLCDDMFDHLDTQAMESTFATLKNIKEVQFIFAGVKECANAGDIIVTP